MNTTHTIAPVDSVAPPRMDRRLMWIMAVACGLSVANLYYVQPILAEIGRTFHVSVNQVGAVTTLSQIGFALGLLLIVPLGDIYNKRALIVGMLIAVSIALVAFAEAPTLPFLIVASFFLGLTTVIPQMIVPFAAILANAHERGRVVGTVMSGLLIGILLARTVSGFISAQLGWRVVYWLAAGMMILLAIVLRLALPQDRSHGKLLKDSCQRRSVAASESATTEMKQADHYRGTRSATQALSLRQLNGMTLNYGQLLASLVELARSEPLLREVGLFGAMIFGAFSVFWVTLAFFLETPSYHYGSEVAGLFGLVGVAGALAASVVGKLTDRMEARHLTGITLLISLLSFVVLWFLGHWLWGLAIGVILLDLGVQGAHVSNQTRIYRLDEKIRNRANTVYMVPYFIGGSIGSFLGTYSWSIAGWNGVCIAGAFLIIIALGTYALNNRSRLQTSALAN